MTSKNKNGSGETKAKHIHLIKTVAGIRHSEQREESAFGFDPLNDEKQILRSLASLLSAKVSTQDDIVKSCHSEQREESAFGFDPLNDEKQILRSLASLLSAKASTQDDIVKSRHSEQREESAFGFDPLNGEKQILRSLASPRSAKASTQDDIVKSRHSEQREESAFGFDPLNGEKRIPRRKNLLGMTAEKTVAFRLPEPKSLTPCLPFTPWFNRFRCSQPPTASRRPLLRAAVVTLLLALSFFAAIVSAPAAGLTSGADFLLVNTGARPDAMGGAFSAVADDINTLSYNPAGLANIRLPEAGYGRYDFVAGVHFDFLGLASPIGKYGVIGLGYIGEGTDPFNSTDDPNAVLGQASEQALILGWGKSFGRLHLGLAGKWIHRDLGTVTGSGFLGDVGFRYRIQPRLTFAGSMMNMGPDIRMAVGEKPPTTARTGAAWRVLELRPHTIDLMMDCSYSLSSRRPLYGWGTEYWFQDRYALRAGWVGNSEAEGFTTGAGFKLSFIQIDYAFQPYAKLGSTNRVSGIFRWDGPWIQGGEPNPPKYVRVRNLDKGLEVRWDKPAGPVQLYEVMVRPLDGGAPKVYSRVPGPPLVVPDVTPGTLYSVSVRSIGNSGNMSYPTQPQYALWEKAEAEMAEEKPQAGPEAAALPAASTGENIKGALDAVGLSLQWDAPKDMPGAVYNVYLVTSGGDVRRLSREPKQVTKIWIPDSQGMEGGRFLITASRPGEEAERRIASFTWNPTKDDLKALRGENPLHLKATPQGNGTIFVDWDADAGAAGYTLFFSAGDDGLYQLYGDLPKNRPWVVLNLKRKDVDYGFAVVSHDAAGKWLRRAVSAGDLSQLLNAPPTGAEAEPTITP